MQLNQRLSYSVEQAAEMIGSNRSSIYAAIGSGELASYKDGRRRRITRKALEDFIAKLERESAGRAA